MPLNKGYQPLGNKDQLEHPTFCVGIAAFLISGEDVILRGELLRVIVTVQVPGFM